MTDYFENLPSEIVDYIISFLMQIDKYFLRLVAKTWLSRINIVQLDNSDIFSLLYNRRIVYLNKLDAINHKIASRKDLNPKISILVDKFINKYRLDINSVNKKRLCSGLDDFKVTIYGSPDEVYGYVFEIKYEFVYNCLDDPYNLNKLCRFCINDPYKLHKLVTTFCTGYPYENNHWECSYGYHTFYNIDINVNDFHKFYNSTNITLLDEQNDEIPIFHALQFIIIATFTENHKNGIFDDIDIHPTWKQ